MKRKLTSTIDVRVTSQLRERLDEFANPHGFATSTLVRAILLAWCDEADDRERQGEEPALDVVLDLAEAESPSSEIGGR